jgi:hypothetical protein
MSLTPGSRLGAYTIAAPLGVGGMGEVYRATDRNLGRDVAIKRHLGVGSAAADIYASPQTLVLIACRCGAQMGSSFFTAARLTVWPRCSSNVRTVPERQNS